MRITRRKRLTIVSVAGLFLLAVTVLRAVDPGFVTSIRLIGFDGYQRLWPRPQGEYPVRIVDIDEASLERFGQWPWRRDRLADLTTALADMGAAAIAYDVIFAEPDRLSPHSYVPELSREGSANVPPEALDALKLSLRDTDRVFARAIGNAPVVLGFAVLPDDSGGRPELKAGIAYAGSNPAASVPAFASTLNSLPELVESAAGDGGVSLSSRDTEGIVRRIPMVFTDGRTLYPSLAMEALRVAQGASGFIVRSSDASGEISGRAPEVTDIKVGAIPFPTTGQGEFWVYFNEDRADRYVSAADVLDPSKRAHLVQLFQGHVVFIGTSSVGLYDIRTTPLGDLVPGVSVHAQAAEQILSGTFLSRPDWADGAEIIATVLIGIAVIALVVWLGAIWAALVGGVLAALVYGGALHLFRTQGLLLDPVYPTLANLFVVYAATTALLYFLTEREKRFVRAAFGQYLAPEMVRRLETAPDALKLGGEMRDMTILFMDVRGFTPISEQLTPTDLVAFLNALLSPLSDEIQNNEGTIDKYIGDSIMAFWNAPMTVEDHARLACRTALDMVAIVDRLNAEDAFRFQARDLPTKNVRIGVGLNTGEACVGNMGSNRRFNYSVIGDAVNVAARIESSCKAVGADCVVSQDTALAAPDFAFLEAGAIPLKGKSVPIKLFALVGDPALAKSPAFKILAERHERLVAAIEARDRDLAESCLAACREAADGKLSDFYDRFAERVSVLPADTPA
ncbi:MAG: adenylate/guanylate cyclase domain-containing protein [Stappia sp.]|nr:adenylate/guanylate cyclase domain-containing protein [Stappia sp.]